MWNRHWRCCDQPRRTRRGLQTGKWGKSCEFHIWQLALWKASLLFFNQESKSFSFDGVTTFDHVQVGSSGATFAAVNQHNSDPSDSKPSEPLLWAPAASCWVGVQRLQRSSAIVWSLQHSPSDRQLCRQTGNCTQPRFIPAVFKGSNLNLCFRSWQTCSIVCFL